MTRTTLVLPEPLHQKLTLTAKREGISLTRLVQRLLALALASQEDSQLPAIYHGLQELQGAGQPGITDASTTINQTLYGQKGVWRSDV